MVRQKTSQLTDRKTELTLETLVVIITAFGPIGWGMLNFPFSTVVGLISWAICCAALIRIVWLVLEHKVRRSIRLAACIAVGIAVFAVLWRPTKRKIEAEPTSDVRVEKESPLPYKANESTKLNVTLFNDNPHILKARMISLVAVTEGFNSNDARKQAEASLWAMLRGRFEQIQSTAAPTNYSMDVPPKIETTMTLNVENDPNNQVMGAKVLSPDQAANLQKGGGPTTVLYMLILSYEDEGQSREMEYCVLSQGAAVVRCMIGHNGPSRSSLSHWWD